MIKILRFAMVATLIVASALTHGTDRVCASSPFLLWPVRGPISQYFSTAHQAIDIYVPVGTSVKAAQSGTVVWAGWKLNGGGNVVDINHGAGQVTTYDHLSQVLVRVGQRVSMGQRIALSGATGNVTGPHLHFGFMWVGRWVNPLPYLHYSIPNTALPYCP